MRTVRVTRGMGRAGFPGFKRTVQRACIFGFLPTVLLGVAGCTQIADIRAAEARGVRRERSRVLRGLGRFTVRRAVKGATGDVKLLDGFRSHVEQGKEMLASSGLNFTNADSMDEAAQKIVALAK